ncbi:MAG: sigma-70 family RNA polymerase sigma factor [Spirochaetales bacterium]|nr:sigma-70 family RNA polymerase sigma factor [Spirochaetales bacterium]
MNEAGPPPLSDKAVVRLVRKGHKEYFRFLVDRYQSRVFAVGMRFLRNKEDARDFTQDVFLKAYEALPGFRGGMGTGSTSFASWITRIAWRQGINVVQRRKVSVSLEEAWEPVTREGPESEHLRRGILEALREASRGLTSLQVSCLELSFFYGLKYREISEITEVPVNTVKSHVFRAKKLLKEKLRGTEAEGYHELRNLYE